MPSEVVDPPAAAAQPVPSRPVVVVPEKKPPTAPPPAITEPSFAGNWVALESWSRTNGFGSWTHSVSKNLNLYQLRAPRGTLSLTIGSQLALWNGVQFWLGFPPQMIGGQPYLHRLDIRKNLVPLLQPPSEPRTGGIIVLDPGHGGDQTGTRSAFNNHFEKEYALDWALRLQSLLSSAGWRVFLTRTTDHDISLSNRVAFAEKVKADLFISLHFNWTPHADQAGLETYCTTPPGMNSSVTRGYEDDATLAFPNNSYDAQNFSLAMKVHRAILETSKTLDRGVRRARFMVVLRGQKRPAILIEGGYLSNPREARLVATQDYRQRLAEAVAHALISR
jgi:N-acetylmuramoyl-L-alanine amidase